MGVKSGDFEFELKQPLEYKFEGSTERAFSVVLKEPGMEHIKFYSRLRQMLTRSQMDIAKHAGAIKTAQAAAGEVVKPISEDAERIEDEFEGNYLTFTLALHASESVDLGVFMSTFEKMITARSQRALCLVDNRVAMTGALWNNLHPDDAIEIAVRWCVFFGMPSQEGERTTSDRQSDSHTEQTGGSVTPKP